VERAVQSELDARLGPMSERLSQVEQSIGAEDTAAKLVALEATVRRRLTNLEEAVRSDDLPERLGSLERAVAEALHGAADAGPNAGGPAFGGRLEALERMVGEGLAGVEESLRSADVVRRLEALETSVGERLGELRSSLAEVAAAPAPAAGPGGGVSRPSKRSAAAPGAMDEAIIQRLSGLEGSLKRLQEDTSSRLDDLRAASIASEAGILERIVAESHVVGAHFQAVRPVVEAAVAARPEIEAALAEVRRLADAAREAAAELMAGVGGAGASEDPSGPYRVESLEEAAAEAAGQPPDDPADSVFQPPEETPIPDRRFGILPRRDR